MPVSIILSALLIFLYPAFSKKLIKFMAIILVAIVVYEFGRIVYQRIIL